jgi:Domain of unknown function (DUF4392)
MSPTIEDIILRHDQRGVSTLRPHLPADFCTQAAQYIINHPGDVLIATGFYILSAGQHETDGPPGAIAIGNALQALGRKVSYVSDLHTAPMLQDWLGNRAEVIDFPIADVETSQRAAKDILGRANPALLISIERCGRTRDDTYLNMRSVEITAHTARLDYMFESGISSIGIGDGGNEIGMGNLAEIIPTVDRLPKDPAVTRVDRLIIASVSNWGGYGLVSALSRLAGRNLLPAVEEDERLIRRMVETGAVDGTSGENKYYVDNFTLEQNGELLAQLHRLVAEDIGMRK